MSRWLVRFSGGIIVLALGQGLGCFSALAQSTNVSSSGAVTLTNTFTVASTGTTTFFKQSSGDLQFTGPIIGGASGATLYLNTSAADSLTTFTFSGSNSFAGRIQLNRGSLVVDNLNALGNVNNEVYLNSYVNNSVGNLRFNISGTFSNPINNFEAIYDNTIGVGTNNVTLTGNIYGGGGLTKYGTGLLTITGNNSYAKGTTISAGTLQVGNGGTTGTLGAGSVNNSGTLEFNRAGSLTVGNAISGTGSLIQSGPGTTILSANNTYTGGTMINAGTLALSNNNANILSGAITVNSGATLRAQGVNVISDTSAMTLNGGTYAMGTNGEYIGSLTMNGNSTVSGTSGAGGAQFILTAGQSSNSTIKTLTATGTNNLVQANIGISSQWGGVGGNANLNFNVVGTSDSLQVGGVIADKAFDGGGNATSGAITKSGQGTLILAGDNTYTGGASILAGTIQVGTGGTTGNITGNDAAIANNGTLIINRAGGFGLGNAISGSGSLLQAGAGTTTLSGNNSYTGGTTINAGSLLLGSANRLADSGALAVNGGNFNLGGFSDTVGAVTLAGGSITNGTMTGSSYDVRSGNVAAVLAGSGALTKSTTNTVTLAGANTYTGGTTVNAGRLVTASSERLADGGTVTVNSGATLALGGSETIASLSGAGSVEITGNLTTGTTNSTFSGAISGSGGLSKVGAGSFTLAGANTFQGDTILTGGTLVLASSNALWRGGVVTLNSGTTLTVNQRTFVGALDQLGGTINGAGELVSTLTKTDSGSLNAVIADGPDFAAGILKRTAGTTTVGAANTFTGMINLQGGTLQLGAGGSFAAASSLVLSPGGTMNLNNKSQAFSAVSGTGGTVALGSGALTVSGAENSSFGGTISGTGSLTKGGAGDFELTGVSSYTGTTMVSGGTLIVAAGGSIASSSIATVGADAHLKVNGTAGAVSVSGTLSGSGTVGAFTLSSGGTLAVGKSPGLLTASSANWNVGSAFQFEIVDALGTAGTDWDLFSVTGQLNLGGISASNKMLLTILSTDLQNYDVDTEYSWVFAQAASLAGTESWASGLDVTDRFAIDSTGFNGGTQLGRGFKVVTGTDGGLATLSILAVPEPSSGALLVIGMGALAALKRRRSAA
jgi:fibronectin-binding autotransporter adhesin